MLLIFDIDGTLTETCGVDAKCYVQAVGSVLGLTEINTDWESYEHVTDSGIAEEVAQVTLGRSVTRDELERMETHLVELLSNEPHTEFDALPGVAEFLKAVQAEGHHVAIATGGWGASARLKLERSGVEHHGFPMATSSDAVSRTEIMSLARDRVADRVGLGGFSEICYFGDGQWDLAASASLGWRFIGIGSDHMKLREGGTPYTFSDFLDTDGIVSVL